MAHNSITPLSDICLSPTLVLPSATQVYRGLLNGITRMAVKPLQRDGHLSFQRMLSKVDIVEAFWDPNNAGTHAEPYCWDPNTVESMFGQHSSSAGPTRAAHEAAPAMPCYVVPLQPALLRS